MYSREEKAIQSQLVFGWVTPPPMWLLPTHTKLLPLSSLFSAITPHALLFLLCVIIRPLSVHFPPLFIFSLVLCLKNSSYFI